MRRRFGILSLSLLSMLTAVPIASATADPASDLVVDTSAGSLEGVLNVAVKEWRGVPYAAPPVGSLRWRPPAPAEPWEGIRDASAFGPECIQLGPDGVAGSEDCLYLNVFAPASASEDSSLPVMVHLHPGGNTFWHAYRDASALVAHDVIVVTVGYRLGMFGFIGHPALTAEEGTSGEYGALDQLAALRWVQDNIAAFGGDPEQVTLFGSSAGSFDTVALMASPLAEGSFARAAAQGAAFWPLTGKWSTIVEAEEIGTIVSSGVGCESADDPAACLRAVPAERLVEELGPSDLPIPVGGSVLPRPPIQLVTERSTVPLLIGFNREEDAGFLYPFPEPFKKDDWVRLTNGLVGPDAGVKARSLYPHNNYGSMLWSYVTMVTDAVRGCPTRRLANTVDAPVWRYLYTHVYEDDPFLSQLRASHVLEEPFLWGHDVFGFGHVLTPSEELLSERMIGYWTNFAKTGDPNGPGLPEWPRYGPNTERTLTLSTDIEVISDYHAKECGFIDTLDDLFPYPGAPHRPVTTLKP